MRMKAVGLACVAAMLVIGALLGVPTAMAQRNEAPVPPRVEDPTVLIERSLEFRTDFGLRADRDFVAALVDDPTANRTLAGVPLTDVEVREFRRRLRVTARIPALKRYAAARARGSFAGVYVDQRRGGLIYVGFTRDADRHLRALKARFAYPGKLRTFTGRYTTAQLDRLHTRVDRDKRTLEARGVTVRTTSTSVPRNAVEIGVANPTRALERRLRLRYGTGVRIVKAPALRLLDKPASQEPGPGRSSIQSPPFAGGIEINGNGAECTSGFVAADAFSARQFLVTAGHCGSVGSSWKQGFPVGFPVGRLDRNSYRNGSVADGAAIGINSLYRSNEVYVNREGYRRISRVATSDYTGAFICKSGIRTEYTCGQITSVNYTANYPGLTLYEQRGANLYSFSGDSGAPILDFGTAHGILSGGDNAGFTVYSFIQQIQNKTGVRVRTSP